MNKRVEKLRDQSLSTKPCLTPERAILITEFYQSGKIENISIPVARALAFKYILENKKICINEGELIVGERGPEPQAAPTYPEICIHTLEDLEILNSREKISFTVSDDVKKIYQEQIIPFWKGKSIREKIFENMDEGWIDAYETGVFTEFMEQRAPGHTVAGKKVFQKGFSELKEEIKKSMEQLDFQNDPEATNKREELKAMEIVANALIDFARRYSKHAKEMADQEVNPKRKSELLKIAEICSNIPENAPRTTWEALQHYWFIHLGVILELNTWDSFNPGRLDQNLYPFYICDLEENMQSKEDIVELLQCFWVKFNNQPAPPKVGVTAEESNTYTDFCLINLGGVKEDGSDAVNELSYVILDVIEEMRILQPSSMVQISEKTPDSFLARALKIVSTGFGQPSIFNTDAIIQELLNQGKALIDARNGGASGCVETGAFGKESYILSGYFNLTKILEVTLNNGTDPKSGKLIGLQTGSAVNFNSFDELFEAFNKQLNYFIDIKIKGNNIIERIWAEQLPSPFMSLLVDDCIANGKDYNDGGAKYNTTYVQGVGLGTITDSLISIKYNIFEEKNFSMQELFTALENNFDNNPILHNSVIYETPKYGNDEDYVDEITIRIFESFYRSVNGRPNTKGGYHRINLLPTTVHVYFGSVIGATPDGRREYVPISEGISPVQGMDIKGPTAVVKSASKIDHLRTGGTLLNQKFTPSLLKDNVGLSKLAHLIRAYFKLDGHHIQFNVVSAETLREAQKEPEKHRNLIVRVAGYSDYFINLGESLQNEIIRRTEHGSH
ncbi:MAG: glycyl radical protein [Candidatus Heimdallarchaeota archaeon]|nr:glycyl radical protein [Candidatus Heimdallarchaeota archaeon]MCK4954232.1 glycyl radical protein [Candidatus Heimdallarchaeota archaeon]